VPRPAILAIKRIFSINFNGMDICQGEWPSLVNARQKIPNRRPQCPAIIPSDGVGEGLMRRRSRATAWAATLFASLAVTLSLLSSSHAADLIWEVENPFRVFNVIFWH
jgi:hypothetical protein